MEAVFGRCKEAIWKWRCVGRKGRSENGCGFGVVCCFFSAAGAQWFVRGLIFDDCMAFSCCMRAPERSACLLPAQPGVFWREKMQRRNGTAAWAFQGQLK
eukprot:2124027-Rhodomonas_salina.2